MNKEVLIDIGTQLGQLRMYPVFDMCHYLLTALHVREDIQQYQTGKTGGFAWSPKMRLLRFLSFSFTQFYTSPSIVMLVVHHLALFFRFNSFEFFTW